MRNPGKSTKSSLTIWHDSAAIGVEATPKRSPRHYLTRRAALQPRASVRSREKSSATLERFNKSAEATRGKMDRVGQSSEGLADSSSLATGALGALASG